MTKELWWEDGMPDNWGSMEVVDMYEMARNKREEALKSKISKIRRQADKDIEKVIHEDRKERGVHLFKRRIKDGIIPGEEAEVEFRTFDDLVKTEEWIGSRIHDPHVLRTGSNSRLYVMCKKSFFVLGYIFHTSDNIGIHIHNEMWPEWYEKYPQDKRPKKPRKNNE